MVETFRLIGMKWSAPFPPPSFFVVERFQCFLILSDFLDDAFSYFSAHH